MARTIIPILLYHSVAEDPPGWLPGFTVAPSAFDQHLALIRESGRTPLPISDLVAGLCCGRLPPAAMGITFDDGYVDFAIEAASRHERAGFASTLYVTTGGLEGARSKVELTVPSSKMPRWSPLTPRAGRCRDRIARAHPPVDVLPRSKGAEEIVHSKEHLEDALGHPVASFTYRHGYSSRRVRESVVRLGCDSTRGVREAFSVPTDDPYNLARLTVRSTTTINEVVAWLTATGAPMAAPGARATTALMRFCRRARWLKEAGHVR